MSHNFFPAMIRVHVVNVYHATSCERDGFYNRVFSMATLTRMKRKALGNRSHLLNQQLENKYYVCICALAESLIVSCPDPTHTGEGSGDY